jgi:hypothetical protein
MYTQVACTLNCYTIRVVRLHDLQVLGHRGATIHVGRCDGPDDCGELNAKGAKRGVILYLDHVQRRTRAEMQAS